MCCIAVAVTSKKSNEHIGCRTTNFWKRSVCIGSTLSWWRRNSKSVVPSARLLRCRLLLHQLSLIRLVVPGARRPLTRTSDRNLPTNPSPRPVLLGNDSFMICRTCWTTVQNEPNLGSQWSLNVPAWLVEGRQSSQGLVLPGLQRQLVREMLQIVPYRAVSVREAWGTQMSLCEKKLIRITSISANNTAYYTLVTYWYVPSGLFADL